MNSLRNSPVAAVQLDVAPDEWLEFASGQPDFGVFHHPAWSRLMAECYGYRPFVAGVRGADGRLLAGIPLMEVGGALRGRRWVGLPFTDHLEPLAVAPDYTARLLEGVFAASVRDGVSTVEIRSTPLPAPASEMPATHVLHVSQISGDFKEVSRGFKKGHVGGIRKAQRSGVTVSVETS